MHEQRLALSMQFIPDRHWQNKTSSRGFGQRTGGGAGVEVQVALYG